MVWKSAGIRQTSERVLEQKRGVKTTYNLKTMRAPVAQRSLYPLQGLDVAC